MRIHHDSLIFSATDLVNFLGCRHASFLDRRNIDEPAPVAADDPYLVLLQEKGIEHERRYLDTLRREGLEVVEIAAEGSLEDRVARTREAMAAGAEVIYQGALLNGIWHGYADFLVRVPNQSRLGAFSYEPVDTKLSRTAKPKHLLQLCVYALLLAAEQGVMPQRLHVVLGDNSTVALPVAEFQYYFDIARQRLEAFIEHLPQISVGQPCNHCGQCRWRERCGAEWEETDHLSLVANITRSQMAKLDAAGLTTMSALARIAPRARIANLQPDTLERLSGQARLQAAKRVDGKNRYELLDMAVGKGFGRLPRPSKGDLFFDMEGDPLFDGGLEYLFGFVHAEGGESQFTGFWGHDRVQEKRAFQQTVDFITERLMRFPDAHIYHYARYEESALKRLAMLHGTRENEIDNLLRQGKLIDLYRVVREAIRVSEPSYSLKNLEAFYMPKRAGEVKTAVASVVVYEQWRRLGEARLLQEISDYNQVDCRSTLLLRDWLLSLRPSGISWYDGITVAEPDPEREERRSQAEERATDTLARLIQAPADEQPFRQLVGHLLEFHRREAKPEWWAMFNRQELSEEELIDDADCIGGLRHDPANPPQKVARSLLHTFTFPPQDFKLRVGDKPRRAATLEAAGEILLLDEDGGRVGLKIGPKAAPFEEAFSIIPSGPIDTSTLRDAVYRFADSVIAGDGRYSAITSILKREHPRIAGRQPGAAIVSENLESVGEAAIAISRLDHSHMLVQGPPGTGKTYLCAYTIVELLSQGRRVGVASNSHKAINNLLAEIERQALERHVAFLGAKKCSDDEHRHNGAMIADLFKNEEVSAFRYDLIAGTAWLFARPEFDQDLDYLFIDEAGQVSLAHVVAMGVSARNIVLVGDQMQLAQPIKGDHPGASGLSALEYVLGDMATVPPDRGIFLAVTRRMHPDVCRLISDAVYEGRLQPEADNANQQLVLAPGADPVLRASGVCFIPVSHEDCSQKSEAEGIRIQEIYGSLLEQSWIDRDGVLRPLGVADILVVSPYNVQVNHLKSVLPAGARVGTVDKFQGQEAPVVLISMATSSADDMPRNMEFLYSRNRLNVAISRARSLAVVVANPRLLEAPCNRIEQMRLVNTLCFVKAYADASAATLCHQRLRPKEK
jgi:predicted RecB family nuclease